MARIHRRLPFIVVLATLLIGAALAWVKYRPKGPRSLGPARDAAFFLHVGNPDAMVSTAGVKGADPRLEGLWKALVRLDLSTLEQESANRSLHIGKFSAALAEVTANYADIPPPMEGNLKEAHARFFLECPRQVLACHTAFLFYRFTILDFLTRNTSPDRIENVSMAMNRFLSRGMGVRPLPFDELSALIFRMVELEPRNPHLLKLGLRVLLADLLETKASQGDTETKEKFFNVVLKLANAVVPEDVFVMEMRMSQFRLASKLGDMKREAWVALTHFPESQVGPYYLAWAAFLEGDYALTEKYLRESFSKAPLSARPRNSLRNFFNGLGKSMLDSQVFLPDVTAVSVVFEFSEGGKDSLTATVGFPLVEGFQLDADYDALIEKNIRTLLTRDVKPWELDTKALQGLLNP